MKKLLVVLLASLILGSAGAQVPQELAAFQTGFETFATDFAAVLSYNATTGNIWSDAYIKQFPHFGVGTSVGITFVPSDSVKTLFDSMGQVLPAELDQFGLPIPAAAITAKIGGIILPFDFGVKAMILPKGLQDTLKQSKITADYNLIGASLRYALVKQKGFIPDVSVGVSYNRLTGSIAMPLDVPTQSFYFITPDSATHTLALTSPELELGFTTNSFDFTAQASTKLFILTPYIGAGLSAGKSTVTGGLKSTMLYNGSPILPANLATLISQLAAAGIDVPDISADGFLFSSENNKAVFRLYGGFSLNLFILQLDSMVMYVPVTKSLGANVMFRVQF